MSLPARHHCRRVSQHERCEGLGVDELARRYLRAAMHLDEHHVRRERRIGDPQCW